MLIKKVFKTDVDALTRRQDFDVDKETGVVDLGLMPTKIKSCQTDDRLTIKVEFEKFILNVNTLELKSTVVEEDYSDYEKQILTNKYECVCENCRHGHLMFNTNPKCKLYQMYLKLCAEKDFYPDKTLSQCKSKPSLMDITKIKIHANEMFENKGCEQYSCQYIELPIDVEHIDDTDRSGDYRAKLVKIRPCSKEMNKTYLGILINEWYPLDVSASYKRDKKKLELFFNTNPAIYVPELNRIIFGAESYWGRIKDEKDLKDISNDEIENLWYNKMLRKAW